MTTQHPMNANRTRNVLNLKNKRTRSVLIGVATMILVFMAGCSASGGASSSSSPQPPEGGATVAAGGEAPNNGLFGSLAALGIASVFFAAFRGRGRE